MNMKIDQKSEKDFARTLVLCLILGWLGAHRFYVGKFLTGLLQLCTLGGFFVWMSIDTVLLVLGAFKDSDGLPIKP